LADQLSIETRMNKTWLEGTGLGAHMGAWHKIDPHGDSYFTRFWAARDQVKAESLRYVGHPTEAVSVTLVG